MSIPILSTLRLTLRPLQDADAAVLYHIYQQEGVLTYFPSPTPPPLKSVERFIAGQEQHWQAHGYGNWAVTRSGEEEIIGWAGLQFLKELDETEVGYLLAPAHWGKGYATEAAQAALCFGFNRFDLDHIIALVHPDNLASRRVIEKCGLHYLETIQLWNTDLMRYCMNREQNDARI